MPKIIRVGTYGIELAIADNGDGWVSGTITSNFDRLAECKTDKAAFDAVERLILALACEGIDVATPAFRSAIDTVVDTIGNDD